MYMPVKILTLLALAAAGAFPGAASPYTKQELINKEATWATFFELGTLVPGFLLAYPAMFGDEEAKAWSIGLLTAYPLATASGAYLAGERYAGPSERKARTFLITTGAAYGQTLALGGIAYGIGAAADNKDVTESLLGVAAFVDVMTKPIVVAYVYEGVKVPAAEGGGSRLAVEPYACMAASEDGRALPLYGASLSF